MGFGGGGVKTFGGGPQSSPLATGLILYRFRDITRYAYTLPGLDLNSKIVNSSYSIQWRQERHNLVGCVAQLVERRSLTGELSLSCARPAADG